MGAPWETDDVIPSPKPWENDTPDSAPAPVAEEQYQPSFLPITRVPAGQGNFGMSEHKLVVPGVLKDIYNTVIEGGEAARGMRDPEGPARDAALLAVGAPAVGAAAKVAPTVAKEAAAAVIPAIKDVALTAKAIKTMPPVPPAKTMEQLKAAAKTAYTASENAGVVIEPQSFSSFVASIPTKLEGFHPDLTPQAAPKSAAILTALEKQATAGKPITLTELDSMRKAVGAASRTTDPNESRLLGGIRDTIDDYVDTLSPSDISPFVSQEAAANGVAELNAARSMWHRAKKIEDIEDILQAGEDLRDPRYVQNKFRSLRKNKRQFNRYSPEEKTLISKIARTGIVEGAGRVISPSGNDLTSSLRLLAGSGLGAAVAGGPGAVAVPALGLAARIGGETLRSSRINDLKTAISRGSPAPTTLQRISAERARLRAQSP